MRCCLRLVAWAASSSSCFQCTSRSAVGKYSHKYSVSMSLHSCACMMRWQQLHTLAHIFCVLQGPSCSSCCTCVGLVLCNTRSKLNLHGLQTCVAHGSLSNDVRRGTCWSFGMWLTHRLVHTRCIVALFYQSARAAQGFAHPAAVWQASRAAAWCGSAVALCGVVLQQNS